MFGFKIDSAKNSKNLIEFFQVLLVKAYNCAPGIAASK